MRASNLLERMRRSRPSPALVVSIIALIVACAGTATAAKVLITSSTQVKNGVLTGKDIRDGSVSSRDLRSSLQRSLRARSAAGVGGDTVQEVLRRAGPDNQPPNQLFAVATVRNVDPGTYVITAKTIMTPIQPGGGLLNPTGNTADGHCVLDAGGTADEGRANIGATFGTVLPGTIYTQMTRTFSAPGTVQLKCGLDGDANWRATDTSIILSRVGRLSQQLTNG